MEKPTPPEDVARLRAAIERADPPVALRLRVERDIAQARERRARRRRASVGVLMAAATAVAVGVVLPGDSAPSLMQVLRATAAAPRVAPPPVERADHRRLAAHVDDVWFPNWRGQRWHPVARTSQTIGGRRSQSVYYARGDGQQIAYTILAARTLPWPRDTRVVTRGGTRFDVYADRGRRVVGWRERNHQCLIAAPLSLSERTVLALAADKAW